MTSSPVSGLPVPVELQRSAHREREEWIASGVFAVELLCRTVDRADLAVEGTRWEVVSVDPPGEHIQHSMVCRPV